jgi:alcohol dehydrogenase
MTECRAGAVGELATILESVDPRAVVLVTGCESYRRSGAATQIDPMLATRRVERIEGVRPNPTDADVGAAVELLRRADPDLIVAVGGGSVIDLAKSARGLVAAEDVREAILSRAMPPSGKRVPLVAVPTTAGTGSEATHFSALYVEGVKHSIGDESFRPDYVLLDAGLTASMSPRLTAETGLDALAQAIESFWSARSTEASLADARRALELAWSNLDGAVHKPTPERRRAMCAAAHLAGRAIDVSKTTAPHALSYSITVRHGVAHGHAVALTLGALLEFNSHVGDEDCRDPRGAAHVRERVAEILGVLGARDGAGGRQAIEALVRGVGLATTLSGVGVATPADRRAIVESVDAERLANNPRALGPLELLTIVDGIG